LRIAPGKEEGWLCVSCRAAGETKVACESQIKARIKISKQSHDRLLMARREFLRERRSLFEPLCDQQALQRAIENTTKKSKAPHIGIFTPLDVSPSYINAKTATSPN
jgi:hypothetical protein